MRLKSVLTEPLLHFLVIGLVLYGLAEALSPEPQDPRTIRIDATVQRHLADVFMEDQGRLPTTTEMDRMVETYIRNETLYREARFLKLDDGDEMMRERLAQRMRLMLYSGIVVEPPSDDVLRPWVAERAERYSTPARMSFRVIGLDAPEAEARTVAEIVAAREAAGDPVKSTEYYIVSFRDRPQNQLVRLFGEDFVAAIEGLTPETWTPVTSPRGWQVARLEDISPAEPAVFEELAGNARAHWQEAQKQAEARAALEALMKTYPVVREPYASELIDDSTDPNATLTQ